MPKLLGTINSPSECPHHHSLCPKPERLRIPPTGPYFYCQLMVKKEMQENGWKRASSQDYWRMQCDHSYADDGKFPDWCPLVDAPAVQFTKEGVEKYVCEVVDDNSNILDGMK